MYEQVVNGVRNPGKVLARGRRGIGKVQNRFSGCDVMREDWDNLLILDACRFDQFDLASELPGTLESRRSKGSATREFVHNNFVGRRFHDTVYVTGNPFVSIDAGDAFHDIHSVWETNWDDQHGTVLPEAMRDAVLRANEDYPRKRLVGHFMQPHHPFVGPTGRELFGDTAGNEVARQRAIGNGHDSENDQRVWQLVADGDVTLDAVETAYDENLDVVLPYVEQLVESLPGKTVVTSDHGNLLDEPAYRVLSTGSRRYAHPKYATAEALVKVPWLVCPSDDRKRVTEAPPVSDSGGETERTDVEDRLEALGYR